MGGGAEAGKLPMVDVYAGNAGLVVRDQGIFWKMATFSVQKVRWTSWCQWFEEIRERTKYSL